MENTNFLPLTELALASHNSKKQAEFARMFAAEGLNITVLSAADLNLPEPEETEDTFAGNALLKASAAAKFTGKPALADDSGIVVPALSGTEFKGKKLEEYPGIYSARLMIGDDGEKVKTLGMERIQEALDAKGEYVNRSAYFVCVLAVVLPNGTGIVVEGKTEGTIVWPVRGTGGFGYDPFFVPNDVPKDNPLYGKTFGEMTSEEKGEFSHRDRAFKALLEHPDFVEFLEAQAVSQPPELEEPVQP